MEKVRIKIEFMARNPSDNELYVADYIVVEVGSAKAEDFLTTWSLDDDCDHLRVTKAY